MRVYVYTCPEPPNESQRFMARCWAEVPRERTAEQVKAKASQWVWGWLPVAYFAATEEWAREKAQTHWDQQIEAKRKKRDNAIKAGERLKAGRQKSPAPVVEEEPI